MQRRLLHAVARNASGPIFSLSPIVQHFSAGLHRAAVAAEPEWASAKACVQAARQAGAVAVWLGGTEPLFHPAIGEVTSALVDAGYYVFLHTSGAGLRKRIHEFKPVGRLYLTLEVPTSDALDSQLGHATIQAATFPSILEAFRGARLSGFYLCAHFTATGTTSPASVASRLQTVRPYLDGIVISSFGTSAANDSSAVDGFAAISKLIPSAGWQSFSRLLQASCQPRQKRSVPSAVRPTRDDQSGTSNACEESA